MQIDTVSDVQLKGALSGALVVLCGACMQTCPANLQAGADAEAKEQSGQRAIDVAAGARQREVVELLLPRTAPEEGQEWSIDALMERAAPAAHQDHQHSDCCGCAHEHPHVEEQVLARLGSNKTACGNTLPLRRPKRTALA